jgi:hypothetical protein
MWVMLYKFNKRGYLVKAKARLVVRGDQQAHKLDKNTYVSTLADRSFLLLMVIAARFDLAMIYYDVVHPFVHASLPYPVYMRDPPGYWKTRIVVQLLKALYGLRESPLLWQKEISSTLTRAGYKKVPHEPCCYTKEGVIIFFYVDDIVVAYCRESEQTAREDIQVLEGSYRLQGGEDLQWFLGIEII